VTASTPCITEFGWPVVFKQEGKPTDFPDVSKLAEMHK
jgi:hypothetical protein